MTESLEISYAAIPGLNEALNAGLTEHLQQAIPGAKDFNWIPVSIPYYAEPGSTAGKPLNKDDPNSKRVIGGLSGNTLLNGLWITLLWCDESARHKGIGSKLMLKAEEAAREKGCTSLYVDTGSFQAPLFYPKLGYKEYYRAKDVKGPGVDRIFFRKDL